jgi:hypothetical protein
MTYKHYLLLNAVLIALAVYFSINYAGLIAYSIGQWLAR